MPGQAAKSSHFHANRSENAGRDGLPRRHLLLQERKGARIRYSNVTREECDRYYDNHIKPSIEAITTLSQCSLWQYFGLAEYWIINSGTNFYRVWDHFPWHNTTLHQFWKYSSYSVNLGFSETSSMPAPAQADPNAPPDLPLPVKVTAFANSLNGLGEPQGMHTLHERELLMARAVF